MKPSQGGGDLNDPPTPTHVFSSLLSQFEQTKAMLLQSLVVPDAKLLLLVTRKSEFFHRDPMLSSPDISQVQNTGLFSVF